MPTFFPKCKRFINFNFMWIHCSFLYIQNWELIILDIKSKTIKSVKVDSYINDKRDVRYFFYNIWSNEMFTTRLFFNMLHLLVTVSMLRMFVRSFSQVKSIRPASLKSPMDVLSLFFTNFNMLKELHLTPPLYRSCKHQPDCRVCQRKCWFVGLTEFNYLAVI